MNEAVIDTVARALGEGSSRRGMLRGLNGLAIAGGITHFGLSAIDAKKRKKKGKNRKKKGKGGGNDGGGGGGCNQTICNGQCIDLNSDEQNCGACGDICAGGSTCVDRRCVIAFGRQGDGELDSPLGLAIKADGTFIVADSNNQRIVNFEEDEFLNSFGERGEGDGQFLQPSGLAINEDTGAIYVTDIVRHCIQRSSSDGVFELTFGNFGSGDQQVEFPIGIAIDQQTSQVFVADSENSRIKRLNQNLFFLEEVGRPGGGNGQFQIPEGLAMIATATSSSPTPATTASKWSTRMAPSCAPSANQALVTASSTNQSPWQSTKLGTFSWSIWATTAFSSSRLKVSSSSPSAAPGTASGSSTSQSASRSSTSQYRFRFESS